MTDRRAWFVCGPDAAATEPSGMCCRMAAAMVATKLFMFQLLVECCSTCRPRGSSTFAPTPTLSARGDPVAGAAAACHLCG